MCWHTSVLLSADPSGSHAVVMTVLIPFQLVFVRVFTAFHALVMDDLTEAVAEVVRDLNPYHPVLI